MFHYPMVKVSLNSKCTQCISYVLKTRNYFCRLFLFQQPVENLIEYKKNSENVKNKAGGNTFSTWPCSANVVRVHSSAVLSIDCQRIA